MGIEKKEEIIKKDGSQNFRRESTNQSMTEFSSIMGSYVLSPSYETLQWMVRTEPPIYSKISITNPDGSVIKEFELNEQNPIITTNRPSGGYRYHRNITLKLDINNNKLILDGALYFATNDPRPSHRWYKEPLDNIIMASW